MSLRHRCVFCDAPIDPYGRDGVDCDDCKRRERADVPYTRMTIKELPDGRFQVAA